MGSVPQSGSSRLECCDPGDDRGHEPQAEHIDETPGIRRDKVDRVRSAIADGSYDEEALLERVLESLAHDVGVVCPAEDSRE
jgi:hypothetical protein